MRHLPKTSVWVVSVLGLVLPSGLDAATCTAQARYVKAEPKDAKGSKQAITLAVSASRAGHGFVTYNIAYKDKDGNSQTEAAVSQYAFVPSAASSASTGGGSGGAKVADEAVLGAGACAEAKPCKIVSVAVNDVTCFQDEASKKCTAKATYVDSAPKDATGSKQGVNFDVASSDCGAGCHGLVKYTIKWTDKDGAEKADAKSGSYKMSGGGAAPEVEVIHETNLAPVKCSDRNPCTVTGATIEKVSCSAD